MHSVKPYLRLLAISLVLTAGTCSGQSAIQNLNSIIKETDQAVPGAVSQEHKVKLTVAANAMSAVVVESVDLIINDLNHADLTAIHRDRAASFIGTAKALDAKITLASKGGK